MRKLSTFHTRFQSQKPRGDCFGFQNTGAPESAIETGWQAIRATGDHNHMLCKRLEFHSAGGRLPDGQFITRTLILSAMVAHDGPWPYETD